tara:strand:- start:3882 stop:4100 length:219 start_codon:yes stop_codon:yes gene_type:complete
MLNLKISHLILLILLTIGFGVLGTWFFSTWKALSRNLQDISSMTLLSVTLLIAGVFIVQALAKSDNQESVKS